jgi:hypothetical protein
MPSRDDGTTNTKCNFENCSASCSQNGFRYLVSDEQERFVDGAPHVFVHHAYLVDKPSDVQDGSELEARVYPEFEKLALHFVQIHRRGKTIDALKTSEIRVINAENDRERFMYDDGKDVVVVLKDVRRGDIIEWAYSISGQNPALGERILFAPRLARNSAVKSLQVRLLVPRASHVQYRLHGNAVAPTVTPVENLVEYLWKQNNVIAVEDEGDTPRWYQPEPWVEFSDYSSWADVAAWALPQYTEPKTLPAELEALISEWRRLDSDSHRLLSVLRFVQEELRYLGMEIGPHSLKPHSPVQTFEQRFGDCKDKTLLFVTILHRLGIDAVPALVASETGRLLPERLPSPYAFDHVIARVRLDANVYWFDPTVASERGDLRARKYADFWYALPIAPDTKGLESVRREPLEQPLSEIEERYDLGSLDGTAILTVNTSYRGVRADEFRSQYEQRSLRELKRDYINYFAKRFDEVTFLDEPTVVDDEVNNVVKTKESYRIAGLFRENEALFTPWSFDEILRLPDVVQRRSPLSVRFPFLGKHRVVLSYETEPKITLPDFDERDPSIRFSVQSELKRTAHQASITYTLESLDDVVSVGGLSSHWALRRRIDSHGGIRLARTQPSHSIEDPRKMRFELLVSATLGALLSGVVAVIWRSIRRTRLVWRTKPFAKFSTADQREESSSVT